MVDGPHSVLGEPAGLFGLDIGKERLEVRMLYFLAQDSIEFTVNKHLNDLLSLASTHGRIGEFRDMGVLEGDPLDRIEIDTVIIGQNAAQPGAGRRGEGTNADTLAVKTFRR